MFFNLDVEYFLDVHDNNRAKMVVPTTKIQNSLFLE
jgi:hypothetical protein